RHGREAGGHARQDVAGHGGVVVQRAQLRLGIFEDVPQVARPGPFGDLPAEAAVGLYGLGADPLPGHVVRLVRLRPRQSAPATALLDEPVDDLERGGEVFGRVKYLPDGPDRLADGRPHAFRGLRLLGLEAPEQLAARGFAWLAFDRSRGQA